MLQPWPLRPHKWCPGMSGYSPENKTTLSYVVCNSHQHIFTGTDAYESYFIRQGDFQHLVWLHLACDMWTSKCHVITHSPVPWKRYSRSKYIMSLSLSKSVNVLVIVLSLYYTLPAWWQLTAATSSNRLKNQNISTATRTHLASLFSRTRSGRTVTIAM